MKKWNYKGEKRWVNLNSSVLTEALSCKPHTALVYFQDGHFENTYYSDFISNLEKIKYAGELLLTEIKWPWILWVFESNGILMWSWQVKPWTYRTSMCAQCSPRTWIISSDTRAPSPPHPATRASCGLCLIHPSRSLTTRYIIQEDFLSHVEL